MAASPPRAAAAVASAFEAGTLAWETWNHRQHLRAALGLVQAGPAEAFARFKAALLPYARAHGVAPEAYHETLTRAYVEAMAAYPARDQACVVAAFADKRVLLRHYARDTLMAPAARAGWVAPDLVPLDVPPEVLVWPAGRADRPGMAAAIGALQDHLLAFAPHLLPAEAMANPYLASLEAKARALEGTFFVARRGAAVVGMACVWIERDFEALESTLTQVAYVSDLVVLPDERGGGVGKLLLAACEEHAWLAGVGHVQLHVLSANERAHAFYAREGYEDTRLLVRRALA